MRRKKRGDQEGEREEWRAGREEIRKEEGGRTRQKKRGDEEVEREEGRAGRREGMRMERGRKGETEEDRG